jgi:hypothetical protein
VSLNPYEDRARLRKAEALAVAMTRLAQAQRPAASFIETVRQAVDYCDVASAEQWVELAVYANVNPPSEATIAAVRELLVSMLPAPVVLLDAFSGLPR